MQKETKSERKPVNLQCEMVEKWTFLKLTFSVFFSSKIENLNEVVKKNCDLCHSF